MKTKPKKLMEAKFNNTKVHSKNTSDVCMGTIKSTSKFRLDIYKMTFNCLKM